MNVEQILRRSKLAGLEVSRLDTAKKNQILKKFSELITSKRQAILHENLKDQKLNQVSLSTTLLERLKLNSEKLDQMVQSIEEVIQLPDPTGEVIRRTELDDGLILEKMTVALGVIAVVFESRPDAVTQILSLALKSGNVVVLKGGTEATHSVQVLVEVARELSKTFPELPVDWVQCVQTRQEFQEILKYTDLVDLVIPRGSAQLVREIQSTTRIPVLGHAEGICHVYVHSSANLETAMRICLDSKTQYPAACNSVETILIDEQLGTTFLLDLLGQFKQLGVQVFGCPKCLLFAPDIVAATETDWQTEYGDLRVSIKLVKNAAQAIDHINRYGSHHTDAIICEDTHAREIFLATVDSASVFANCSTRFADGYRYGLGAEVGVSTSKLHARGPVGLDGLTTTKYILRGKDQIVRDYIGVGAKHFKHKNLRL